MAELVLTKRQKTMADKRNEAKTLYCTECCTYFSMNKEGKWTTRGATKVAELINNSFLQCTCGTNIGVLLHQSALKGEIVGLQ